jgi:hypothetical protein
VNELWVFFVLADPIVMLSNLTTTPTNHISNRPFSALAPPLRPRVSKRDVAFQHPLQKAIQLNRNETKRSEAPR